MRNPVGHERLCDEDVRPAEHIALPHGRYGRSRGKADLIAGHGAHEKVFSACHHVTAREEASPSVVRRAPQGSQWNRLHVHPCHDQRPSTITRRPDSLPAVASDQRQQPRHPHLQRSGLSRLTDYSSTGYRAATGVDDDDRASVAPGPLSHMMRLNIATTSAGRRDNHPFIQGYFIVFVS